MRINKYLAGKGFGSRRMVDGLIDAGRVLLNGEKAELGSRLKNGDIVEVSKQRFEFTEEVAAKIIIAFNKPAGVVCTNEEKEKNNLVNYIKNNPQNFRGTKERYQEILKARLFSIGRLDKDSRGLLLLTNDGDLSQRLSHPKYEKEKEYIVTCEKEIDDQFIYLFSSGVEISINDEEKQVKTKKCKATMLSENQFSCVLKQGYKRQIRLMVRALNNRVLDLQRIRISNLSLENLEEGNFKEIDEQVV